MRKTTEAVTPEDLLSVLDTHASLQSPLDVLDFWFGDSIKNASRLAEYGKLWWKKSDHTDRLIARRGLSILSQLVSGESAIWAERSPEARLAAIIVLDQFPRNIFRDMPASFENDPIALSLCKDGLQKGELNTLHPIHAWFYLMPLMHSENLEDQQTCVGYFKSLLEVTPPDYKTAIEDALTFARKHREVIEIYGRFPHRNSILNRASTPQEKDYLSRPGAGF